MQNAEKEKPVPDQVILVMDQTTPKPKQSTEYTLDPIDPTTTTTCTLRRLNFSKPKARFVELNHPNPLKSTIPVSEELEPNKPFNSSDSESEGEEDISKEDYEKLNDRYDKKKRKIGRRAIFEFVALVLIMVCLICSFTVDPIKDKTLGDIKIWKWCLIILVTFSGRLVSGWLVGLTVFVIERNFMLREKVLYFVYGLRKSVQNCVWLGLVLLSWFLMFNHEIKAMKRPKHHHLLDKVWRALIAVMIGAIIWLIKILLVKVLASSFHVATFFDRMKESVFHHYILETLSGPPLDDVARMADWGTRMTRSKTLPARLSRRKDGGLGASRRIDMERLKRLSRDNASGWSLRRLVSHVMSSGLSTISRTVDRTMEEFRETEGEITSEWEARICAQRIFKNVARDGEKYIEEDDLLRFLKKDEVHTIFPLFEGAMETGKIKKSAFRNWVVRAYVERKALAHSLNDTKTAVQQLHKLASAVVSVIIVVVSLLVMGLATTKVIFVITSQLLLVGFMFGNTCKTLFESIIFVFVMHPFDVGDRCVIDGVQMVVEEMNILTTTFLRFDNEKIYYPNAVLLLKPISNFYRSPEMADSIEFAIDVSTSVETFSAMKKAIQAYIESKPKHWQSKHSVVVKEIQDVNKMKIGLHILHTMNHQNYGEKNSRRSEFVFELKQIFENLSIKYNLLPQEVHLTQVSMASGRVPMP
ncbi:mechanosensitive ion channel protein 10-like [Magnolia sinica]|uniref:mechanosensitive ion channel protein 10-like n=1 Tax=Magnolia sinica TaxID=86752 RepID=UPI0026595F68|nr:mechanosensitive ion channel protein 10-like [Magnolia sinica]